MLSKPKLKLKRVRTTQAYIATTPDRTRLLRSFGKWIAADMDGLDLIFGENLWPGDTSHCHITEFTEGIYDWQQRMDAKGSRVSEAFFEQILAQYTLTNMRGQEI